MLSDLRNLTPESLPLAILLWSGVIMLLTGAVLFYIYEFAKAPQEHEKTDEDRALEDIGIAPTPGFIFVLPFLFPILLVVGAAFVISAVTFGVVLTRYTALGALFIIQTGSPFVAILFVAVAILLYGMRTRYPLVYGIIEVIVGISAIISVLPKQPPAENAVVYAELLSVSAGMYVIVRGLDNINKAIPERFHDLWLILRWGVPLDKK
jgi:hypothetical protein